MNTVAVLCARRSSQRLKGKHWLEIDGNYLWQFAARAMLDARRRGHVGHVLVSSDDKRLTEMACEMGLYPIMRPKELCDDKASIHWALRHALEEYEQDAQLQGKLDTIMFVPANVPTITALHVSACFKALKDSPRATASMTVRRVSDHPEWMWTAGKYLRRLQESKLYRMQDLPAYYIATGTCQAVRRKTLMGCTSNAAYRWLGDKIIPIQDPNAIEVHVRRDYVLAKAVLEEKTHV